MIDHGDLDTQRALHELRTVVQQLTLVSHAPIQGYNYAPNEVGRGERWRASDRKPVIPHLGQHQPKGGGTKVPRGNIDWAGDNKFFDYRQKSAVYFQNRVNDWESDKHHHGPDEISELAEEATAALTAWRKTPDSDGADLEPPRESFLWKCAIADDDRPVSKLMEVYKPIGRQTIYDYRKLYRGVRKQIRQDAA